jgi:NAD(P)-dependent dehydrogenase (short-subunit alcohol dehydrogenase family)
MTRPLQGTVALITGASSGIGEQAAVILSDLGADVVVVARRADRLDALVDRIIDTGGRALAVAADVTDEAEAGAAVERAVEQFGRLDTVLANAGVVLLGPIEGADITDWRRMIELNTLAVMYTARTRPCRTCSPRRSWSRVGSPTGSVALTNGEAQAGWADAAPSRCLSASVQLRRVPVPTGGDHAGGALVSAVRPVLPRRRGATC